MGLQSQTDGSAAKAVKDASLRFMGSVRSGFNLAAFEFKEAVGNLKRHRGFFFVAAVIGLLGILPIMASAVIGIGRLLNNNYGLSSLLIGVLMVGIGGSVALHSLKLLRMDRLAFPHTRRNVKNEAPKVRDISDFRRKEPDLNKPF